MKLEYDWVKNPELREIVKKAYQHVKKLKEEGKSWDDFECYEIGVPPWKLRKLVYDYGILKITHKSRSHTFYGFAIPLEEVGRILEEYELTQYSPETVSIKEKVTEIPEDFWEGIVGYDDLKELFIKSIKANRPVHLLLVGPPSTCKSLMLMQIERLKGSYFVLGGSLTKVGLRDLLVMYRPRFLIIDELDKVERPQDLSTLLTLMEHGRVVITKHKTHKEEKMKTWVFAAANRIDKLYRNAPELLDRFQIFYLKPYDPPTLKKIISNVLVKFENKKPELAYYIAEKVVDSGGELREAIRVSRLADDKNDVDRIVNIFIKYKRWS